MIHLLQDANFRPAIYSLGLASAISSCEVPADFLPIGRRWNPRCYRNVIATGKVQGAYATVQTRLFATNTLRHMHPGDIAIVYESAPLTSRWFDAGFQNALVREDVRYIPVFPDAWPLSESWLRQCCRRRVELATSVGCVTPGLVELFHSTFPGKRFLLLEEPVPVNRFAPDWSEEKEIPTICWSGPPHKIDEVVQMLPVLESVARKTPFRLRIISGSNRPGLVTTIPLEWLPFDDIDYQSRFAGVDIAFACYRDSPYGACKGNYKIKTYMAAGCAIVTSPIGYNLDLIHLGKNGLFASTSDEWEAAFLRLLRNPEERLAMRKAARDTAIRRFSYDAIARQYVQVLRRNGLIGS